MYLPPQDATTVRCDGHHAEPRQRLSVCAVLDITVARKVRYLLRDDSIFLAESLSTACDELRRRRFSVFLVDPFHGVSLADIARIKEEFPQVAIVAHVGDGEQRLKRTVEIVRAGIEHFVSTTELSDTRQFREALLDAVNAGLTNQVVDALQLSSLNLPKQLIAAVEMMFRNPSKFQSADDIARAAEIGRSTLYRHFDECGLASPKRFLGSARFLRAYCYLRNRSTNVATAAARAGYGQSRRLGAQATVLFGRNARDLHEITPETVSHVLSSQLSTSLRSLAFQSN